MYKVPVTEKSAIRSEYDVTNKRRIYQLLSEFEERRIKYFRFAIWLACISNAFYFGSFIFDIDAELGVMVGAVGTVMAIVPMLFLRENFKEKVLPHVLREYGLRYDFEATDMPLDEFLPIMPVFSVWDVSDHMWGRYKGVRMSIAKLKLRLGTASRNITVFSGLVGYFQFPKTTASRVIVTSSAGAVGDFTDSLISSDQRVWLEDPEFEQRFDVYCDDQVAARYILTPLCMQRLVELEKTHPGLRVVFQNSEVLIAIPNEHDLFEINFFFSPITHSLIEAFLEDLDQVFALVDALKLDAKTKI